MHGGQWTATLKHNYISKRKSNSNVTLKVTQRYTFRLKFGFETPKLSLKEIQKRIDYQKIF